jgi:UDP-N-acetylmuramoyl-tripeptide--D-alanyl-D-alanine ligase
MRCLPGWRASPPPSAAGARTLLDAPDGPDPADRRELQRQSGLGARRVAPWRRLRASLSRRVAVLGDMLELGERRSLHRGLKEAVDAAGVDLVLACGPMMRLLLDDSRRAAGPGRRPPSSWSRSCSAVQAGDVVMIKGSLGTRMAPLVAAMLARFGPGRPGG